MAIAVLTRKGGSISYENADCADQKHAADQQKMLHQRGKHSKPVSVQRAHPIIRE